MVQVARLIGGAGTGKTSALLETLSSAKQRLSVGPLQVGFASFTKAARIEAAERAADAWGVPETLLTKDGWFKTVHAACYKQLEIRDGQIVDKSKDSQRWLSEALNVSIHCVLDEDTGYSRYKSESDAAIALRAWDLSRARIEPLRDTVARLAAAGEQISWAGTLQYVRRYEEAKRLHDRCDYSDLLARFCGVRFDPEGFYETDPEGVPPHDVQVWIFDEAQDASALVDRCCRRLASGDAVKWVYIAGDPFQSVFSFGGSSSDHFMSWEVSKQKIMEKSWRCPRPILDLGERCLRKMRRGYWDRGIGPADHDGEIVSMQGAAHACSAISASTPTLVLARCRYTLDLYRKELQRRRIPFAMLNDADDTKILRAYRAYWDLEHGQDVCGKDLACAIEETPTRSLDGPYLTRGAKAAWGRQETVDRWDWVRRDDLEAIGMTPRLIEAISTGHWAELLVKGERWRAAAVSYGPDLATHPHIRLGTIHSTKGMEADDVVLSTQIPYAVHGPQSSDVEAHDEERRVEYVGVTRARRRLIVSHDTSEYNMRLPA